MVELKSIEHLLHFMKQHIQLSRYDEKFIENISDLKKVTTNQVLLLHRLIFKYRRQFSKHELYVEKLVELPWNIQVVESSPQYTDGHVSIEDNYIYFKCPFNRSFIDKFRNVESNKFTWTSEKRRYEAPYSTYSLKILLNTAEQFFNKIHFCDISKALLEQVNVYSDIKYWQPTLVKLNNRLYVLASNPILDEALGDIELSEDVDTFVKLSKHGVVIGKEFYDSDPLLKFICEPVTHIEQSDLEKLISYIKKLNCNTVFLTSGSSVSLMKKKVTDLLEESGIKYYDITYKLPALEKNNYPILIKFKKNTDFYNESTKVCKIVHVVNSLPIEIK